MKKALVASFDVDHTTLDRGFYLRSTYRVLGLYPIHSYDMRLRAPREGHYLSSATMHTIEHLMAHYLRLELPNKIISFSPMGCQTGFYIVAKGVGLSRRRLMEAVVKVCREQSDLKAKEDVPGLTVRQCGNPALYDIEGSNRELRDYAELLGRLLEE